MAGEAVVGSAVSCFLGILLDPIKQHIGYAFKFRSKFNALSDENSKLKLEREGLHESIEAAQGRVEEVKLRFLTWRTNAETAIADAEVVVRKGEKTTQKSCSICLNLKARYRVGKMADQVKQVIVQLLAEKDSLSTDMSYLPALQQIVERPLEGYEAQSRNRTLKDVMDALSDPNITMVGLYGMGGIGKTTLAEKIYHQATNESLFYKVIIAKPETRDIQDKIADFVIGSELEGITDDKIASGLNLRLNKILEDKKILIILDDIRSVLDLVKVGIPTGNKGCKILMTSRRLDLLSKMGSTKNFPLQVLSEEESMSLFEKKVTVVKDREIAEEILVRCAGFPLMIVTIAGLLKENEDLDAWKDVLTQLKKFDNQEIESKVYKGLELSYDHLPCKKTKLIFLLCGICSRSSFKLTDLLWYSFGLGLLKNYTVISEEQNYTVISEARRHLKTLIGELQACSLLDFDEHGNLRMHDVVRDVAILIACREGLAFRNNELTEWPSIGDIIKCTKVSMILTNIENLPENLGCPDVEFLLLFKRRWWGQINIPDSIFQETKQLKVIHFRDVKFVSMPGSLYSLKNLHTLYLESCIFSNLDVAIGQLVSLEILSFHGSDLEALPSEIGQLTRLKLLDLSKCSHLKFIPANVISKLTSLEELFIRDSFTNWGIEDPSSGSNARLSELKCLSKLASLEVFVPDVQALPGYFFPMCLERYDIRIGTEFMRDLDSGITKSMMVDLSASIDMLEKARNLLMEAEVVCLRGINGVTNLLDSEGFKWKELSITKSSTLQLIVDCGTTVSFSELKILDISFCRKLKSLFSISAVRSLPQLEKIKINSCNEMEALFVVDEGSTQVVEFPCLRIVFLSFLSKLKCFLDVITSKSSNTASTTTKLMSLFNEKVALPSLETLYLFSIDNIKMIWSSGAPGASGQLNSLSISNCDKLEDIVEAGEDSTNRPPFHFFPQLKSLTLLELPKLRSLYPFGHTSKWPNLGEVEIRGCPKTIGIWLFGEQESPTGVVTNQEKAFPNLEKMSIGGVEFSKSNLNSPSWWSHVPALESLKLYSIRERSMLELSEDGAFESLPNLRELAVIDSHIKRLWEYNKRSSGLDSGLPFIRILELSDVAGLRHVGRGNSTTEDPLLPFLESIELNHCSNLISLAPSPSASFRNLSTLKLYRCDKVKGLINPSTARTMVNLVCVEISSCRAMKEIVAAEDDDQSPTECIIIFNKLERLRLVNLDSLKGFCTSGCYSFNFPCLEHVSILDCRSMSIFCNGDAITPQLESIDIGGKWHYKVDINTIIKQLFKDGFHDLLRLTLSEFPHLVERWGKKDIPPFEHLEELVVDKCAPLLPIAVPSNVLPSLTKLHQLVVEKCESVEEIFDLDGMDQENEHGFGVMF